MPHKNVGLWTVSISHVFSSVYVLTPGENKSKSKKKKELQQQAMQAVYSYTAAVERKQVGMCGEKLKQNSTYVEQNYKRIYIK